MQMRTASSAARGQQRWRLTSLFAAACTTVVLAGASAAHPTKAPVPATTYRVIPLAPNGFTAGINAKGQVAFTEFFGPLSRARFYDGTGVRDLGALGGPNSVANALNDLGQVVGSAVIDPDQGAFRAFRWSKQTGLVDLNPPGVGDAIATDINNKGQVVGVARFNAATGLDTAFRWSPRTGMVNLGSLGPTSRSVAFGINDAGTATGSSDGADGPILTQVVKWPASGGLLPLNNFPSIASVANDINNAGQIVGSAAFDGRLNDQAFIWTREGGLQGMGTEPSVHSFAERVNEKGLVTGTLITAPTDDNGFIWSRENGLLVLGTPSVDFSDAADLNDQGQVVGHINGRAFVWTRAGGFVDLNTRIPGAPAGLELFSAEAISNNGTIVAGTNAGNLVLLVPQSGHAQPPVTAPVKFTGLGRVNALLSFSAGFTDVDVRDTHKAVWSWGDGSKTVGTVSERKGTGSVSAQHAFRAAGIYTVRLTVTDSSGKSSTVERKVVVCGAKAAITGEGAFASPGNAARSGARRGAIGRFAFLSEGADGRKAAVEVNVAGLALRSSQVDAVTLDGGRVQYSGRGSVNGRGNYRFTLMATSGAKSGAKDRIHVRIAHTDPRSKVEVVDYDNGALTKGAAQKAATAGVEGSVVIGEGKFEFGTR
ncbi:PKD domain-containing protein [Massilia sp. CMS3.1]|uniref:PKD domain-containing protein n=1 Tax=Massilia sp. CMS3.1 TaxID=3373083 RepID=UPI003EE659E1